SRSYFWACICRYFQTTYHLRSNANTKVIDTQCTSMLFSPVFVMDNSAPSLSALAMSLLDLPMPHLLGVSIVIHTADFDQFWFNISPFRINTCKSVSKQRALSQDY